MPIPEIKSLTIDEFTSASMQGKCFMLDRLDNFPSLLPIIRIVDIESLEERLEFVSFCLHLLDSRDLFTKF
jgi:hypothetical protein